MREIPYIVYEGTMARFERIIHRLILILTILVLLLCATNGWWIYRYSTTANNCSIHDECISCSQR